ncbi:MAG TPA: outer membrane beta-barrel protein [Salinimicrobium sp.]|nr:outer membrane beta-barrel protein [Salinimicrobium sp.]
MKKLLIVLICAASPSLFAQSSFGVTAGLNFADNGEIEFSDATSAGENIVTSEASRKTGYHFGIYYRAELGRFYLKPELWYTQTKSKFEYNNTEADFEISKLDLPILVGVRVIGPLNVFAGPSLQYIMDQNFEGANLEDLENDFTVGAQFGIGAQFGGIGIDVRYEQALNENQAEFLGIEEDSGRLDSRPNQFIVSLSLDL